MGNEQHNSGQSIHAVAGKYITVLYQDDQFDVFRLCLPTQATLKDHATGPRIIILLTDLAGKRLADNSEFAAPQGAVMYLTNTFSPGFINHSKNMAEYLVVGLNQGELSDVSKNRHSDHTSLVSVFSQGHLQVCLVSEEVKPLKTQHDVLHYQVRQDLVRRHTTGGALHLSTDDWVIKILG